MSKKEEGVVSADRVPAVKAVSKKSTKWFKISKRVSLPVNQEKVDEKFVPKDIAYEDNKKTLEQVAIGIAWKMPTLLIGETGTGKTSMIRHIAHMTNNAFARVNHNGGTTIEDLVGRWTIDGNGKTVWVDGILVQAMKKGWYFLADEINAASAEVNFVYHSLLDDDARILLAEKGDEVVVPHKNFRFFGAMNPPTEYAGTKELNKALMSRFMVVNVEFPAPKTEQKILIERTGITEDVAERMVRQAGEVRVMHAKEEVRYVFSTRDLIMWANMFKVYGKYLVAAEMTVLNKIGSDDIDAIKDLMALNFKSLDDGNAMKEEAPTEEIPEEAEVKIPF